MPKIIAWQCPHTGELFAFKNEYVVHLRKLAQKRRRERLYAKFCEGCRQQNQKYSSYGINIAANRRMVS